MGESKKTRAEMVGEALREVGVLALVFIPLDHAFSAEPALPLWAVVLATIVFGLGAIGLGVLIEEIRE
jgi:hypothetical protein